MIKNVAKALFCACILSMIVSCSGSSSSSDSSDTIPEILDSIMVHQTDPDVNAIEVRNLGHYPAGKEIEYGTVITNFDSIHGAKIISIEGDSLLSECEPSLDSIEPRMKLSVRYKLKVPEEKGPFDATMQINYKNIKKPTILKLHGYAE